MMFLEYIFLFLLGLSMGSFLTVVAVRFDTAESFWKGRSHCTHCKHILLWWELIPQVGYILLRGRCSHCRKIISKNYPLFELLTGAVFVGLRYAQPDPNYWMLIGQLIIASLLIVLFIYDWLNQSFPTILLGITLSVIVLVSLLTIVLNPNYRHVSVDSDSLLAWFNSPREAWWEILKGGIISTVALGSLAFPSRGRWMGYGDVWLAGILGLWIGYPLIILCLIVAFFSGTIVGVIQLVTGSLSKDHRIAFGPFLILGGFVAMIWGRQLFTAIMNVWQFS
jgi:prepilin signal peptidase PulO-like enzyme (type II secretory pathway)